MRADTPKFLSLQKSDREKYTGTADLSNLFLANLQMKHMLRLGDATYFADQAELKSSKIYSVLDKHPDIYKFEISRSRRSRGNIHF